MANLDKAQLEKLVSDLSRLKKEIDLDQLGSYLPYGHPDTLVDGKVFKTNAQQGIWDEWSNKPWQWDFHAATQRERMLMAANRVGKTRSAAAEVSFHLTGRYPEWWPGQRFKEPILCWTGSPTNETSKDIVQKELLGGTTAELLGTGMIPRDAVVGKPKMRQAGVPDVVQSFYVRHSSGGISECVLKTYEQGWRKWQGTKPNLIWMDEEPDTSLDQKKIFSEAQTRLLTTHGLLMVTFTPLLGETDLVMHFNAGGEEIYIETATWDDVPHLLKAERDSLFERLPPHEREARTKGIPMMGEGRIFTTPEEDILVDPFEIPYYWRKLKGVDFGIDHPWGVCDIAHDTDNDVIYVTRTVRMGTHNKEVEEHAAAINRVDPQVPVAWPHDGTNKERSNGRRLKDIYAQDYRVKMLSRSACYKNDVQGRQPVEPVIIEAQQRAASGGLKVFRTCTEFREEYRNFYRKEGKPQGLKEDVLKSFFYALMMKRYATASHVSKSISHNVTPLVRL